MANDAENTEYREQRKRVQEQLAHWIAGTRDNSRPPAAYMKYTVYPLYGDNWGRRRNHQFRLPGRHSTHRASYRGTVHVKAQMRAGPRCARQTGACM